MIEVPFTLSGKAHASDAGSQWKRKIILAVPHTFPWVLARQKVCGRTEINLSPIENSIETLQRRVTELKDELQRVADQFGRSLASLGSLATPSAVAAAAAAGAVAALQSAPTATPRLSSLQALLQGSVRVQVHGGVYEICQAFPVSANVGGRHLQTLCSVLQELLCVCRRALDVDKTYIKNEQVAFHHELENGFTELEKLVVQYIRDATLATATSPVPVSPMSSPGTSFTRCHSPPEVGEVTPLPPPKRGSTSCATPLTHVRALL
eukprot:TRINITY_DN5322_c0_g1_i15.p1 TRINITY_DN5322_c0_g1~~TRINITY_DN5322_c0_g1_i15.p1  ORF type:complete len:265 (+),score=73.01 TRINITY_DN5322_c0_g1_i15:535-1329(+)